MEKHTKENENLQNISFQIKNLYLYYGQIQALKNISTNIEKNKITALIGPSGCGKSTFLRTLNRMNDFIENCRVEGKILYRGKDIYNETDPISLRREVGMVFQQPNPFAKSIYDNIAYGVRLKGITKKDELDEIVEKSLKQAAIWNEVKDRLKKSALGLSGGQQQRLCIGRALAMEPEILLMDESTASLDPVSSAAIEELIMKLKEKYTIIMVTHNMQQARRISDKTAFFYLGELIEYGKTENIFTTPKNERTYRYISGQFG